MGTGRGHALTIFVLPHPVSQLSVKVLQKEVAQVPSHLQTSEGHGHKL